MTIFKQLPAALVAKWRLAMPHRWRLEYRNEAPRGWVLVEKGGQDEVD